MKKAKKRDHFLMLSKLIDYTKNISLNWLDYSLMKLLTNLFINFWI